MTIDRDRAVDLANKWTAEFYPQTFCDDYEDIDEYTALRFYICALDALGQSKVVKPKIMEGRAVDEVYDAAIYYSLRKANETRESML